MIEEKLVNSNEEKYTTKKNKEIDISYSYVSNQIRKKTSRLIDNFQLGLMDKDIDRKDLTDLLKINNRFKDLALETPDKAITSLDLYKVSDFHRILHKYNK